MKKILLAGLSILVVGLLVLGSQANVVGYNSSVQSSASPLKGTVRVRVIESKADGKQIKKTITFSSEQYEQYQQELKSAKDVDAHLCIYKKYGLIPTNVTIEKLRSEVKERARKIGFTPEKIESLRNDFFKWKIFFAPFSFVYVDDQSIVLPVRVFLKCLLVSFFFTEQWLPTINLMQIHLIPSDYHINILRDFSDVLLAVLVGFVGFSIVTLDYGQPYPPWNFPEVTFDSFGFTVLTFGIRYSPDTIGRL